MVFPNEMSGQELSPQSESIREQKTILVSSYSFAPEHGSESELAWRFVERLKMHFRVEVCTNITYAQFFNEGLLSELRSEGVEVHFVALPGLWRRLAEIQQLRRVYYLLWQKALPKWIHKNCSLADIDLVHHISWATYTTPSFLWRLGKPLLVGPVGGGETFPWAFTKTFSFKTRLYEAIRSFRIHGAQWQSGVKNCLRRAEVVWCANPETLAQCRAIAPETDLRLKSQVSLPSGDFEANSKPQPELVVITVSRLIPVKRVDLLIESFFAADGIEGKLVIIGDGEEKVNLEKQAGSHSDEKREVIFKGWLEREELLQELASASLFAFASLHDSASFAVLEALSVGLPVVCLKFGGPGFLVGGEAGLCLEAENDAEAIRLFAEAFVRLADDPAQLSKLAEGARQRALGFTADHSFCEFLETYEQLLFKE